ncbi:MAG TPA: ABC transporter permease [Gaiellaceae bacterium]|nr:ABC transporter permease [Gaiellaceae bacterium]
MTAGTPELRIAGDEKRAANRERIRMARRRRRVTMWSVRVSSLAILLGIWQWYGSSVNPILFAPPTKIARAFVTLTSDGTLGTALVQSLTVFGLGMGAAVVVAIPLALVWARYQLVDWAIQGYVNALYATPLVALVPLLILWFGFGVQAKVIIIFSFAVFPLLINTYQGARSVDPGLVEVAESFGCSELKTWRHVILPSAVPFIAAGLNLAVGRALVGMIIAEFYTSASGLGYMVIAAGNTFQTAKMFVPILVVMALGVFLLGVTRTLKRKVSPWSEQEGRL